MPGLARANHVGLHNTPTLPNRLPHISAGRQEFEGWEAGEVGGKEKTTLKAIAKGVKGPWSASIARPVGISLIRARGGRYSGRRLGVRLPKVRL